MTAARPAPPGCAAYAPGAPTTSAIHSISSYRRAERQRRPTTRRALHVGVQPDGRRRARRRAAEVCRPPSAGSRRFRVPAARTNGAADHVGVVGHGSIGEEAGLRWRAVSSSSTDAVMVGQVDARASAIETHVSSDSRRASPTTPGPRGRSAPGRWRKKRRCRKRLGAPAAHVDRRGTNWRHVELGEDPLAREIGPGRRSRAPGRRNPWSRASARSPRRSRGSRPWRARGSWPRMGARRAPRARRRCDRRACRRPPSCGRRARCARRETRTCRA